MWPSNSRNTCNSYGGHKASTQEPTSSSHATAPQMCLAPATIESDGPPNGASSQATAGAPVVGRGKRIQYRNTEFCPWLEKGRCNMGDACNYAHSKAELKTKPDLACTKICPQVEKGRLCKNGMCRFAHDFSQLRATNAFYKTKMCKYWSKGNCPGGAKCRHAHGNGELRKPLIERTEEAAASRPNTPATASSSTAVTEDEKPNSGYTSTPYSIASDICSDAICGPRRDLSAASFDAAWQGEGETAKPFLSAVSTTLRSPELPYAFYSDADGRMAHRHGGEGTSKDSFCFHPAVWQKHERLQNDKPFALGLSEMDSDRGLQSESPREHGFGISMAEYQPNNAVSGRSRRQGDNRISPPLRWGSGMAAARCSGNDPFHHWRLTPGRMDSRGFQPPGLCGPNEAVYFPQPRFLPGSHAVQGIDPERYTPFGQNPHELPYNYHWPSNEARCRDVYGMSRYAASYNNGGPLCTPMSAPISPRFSPLADTAMMPHPYSTNHCPTIPDADFLEELQANPLWPILPERHEDDNEWPTFDNQTPDDSNSGPNWSPSPSPSPPSREASEEGGGEEMDESRIVFCLRQLSAILLEKGKAASPHTQLLKNDNAAAMTESVIGSNSGPWMSYDGTASTDIRSSPDTALQDIRSSPEFNPNEPPKPDDIFAEFSKFNSNPIAEQNNDPFAEYKTENSLYELKDTLPITSCSTSPSILSALQQQLPSSAFSPLLSNDNSSLGDISPSAADIPFNDFLDLVTHSPHTCPTTHSSSSISGLPLLYLDGLVNMTELSYLGGPVPPTGNPFEPERILTTADPFSFGPFGPCSIPSRDQLPSTLQQCPTPFTEDYRNGAEENERDMVEDFIRITEQLLTGNTELQDASMEMPIGEEYIGTNG